MNPSTTRFLSGVEGQGIARPYRSGKMWDKIPGKITIALSSIRVNLRASAVKKRAIAFLNGKGDRLYLSGLKHWHNV
ncbi:MAG: hypothetical protein ACM65L_04810 [Microcoleus sp.]